MKSWSHPRYGRVEVMTAHSQPEHVWKHFHDRRERWDRVCGEDIRSLTKRAEAAVGARKAEPRELDDTPQGRTRAVVTLLREHHQRLYGPAYMAEMTASETTWAPKLDDGTRVCALTPNSVFIVVGLRRTACVVSAFRPLPERNNVGLSEDAIRRSARRYFYKQTGVDMDGWGGVIANALARDGQTSPQSVDELWSLAVAVGYGRALRTDSSIAEVLGNAANTLRSVDAKLQAELVRELDWSGCAERLATSLKRDQPEALEAVLSGAEDLLAVGDALGLEEASEALCAEAEALLPWIPPDWSHLGRYAARRCTALDGQDGRLLRLWTAVEDGVLAAAVRVDQPSVLPEATLVDTLLPLRPSFAEHLEGLLEQVQSLVDSADGQRKVWADACLGGVRLGAPAMGDGGGETDLVGTPVDAAHHVRAYVVDEGTPDGADVTAFYVAGSSTVWRLDEADEQVLFVLVTSDQDLPELTLPKMLRHARDRSDVHVATKVITRST